MLQRKPQHKELTMKRGHVTGTKREKKGAQDCYKPILCRESGK